MPDVYSTSCKLENLIFCSAQDNLFFMSEANQPQAADREQAYCWIFNARLKIQRPQNTFGPPDPYLIPAKHFEDVLNKCDGYQRSVLKRMEALSYAYNPEWFDLLPGDVLPVTGIMVYKNWIGRVTVENWLTHEDLDVDWNPCIGRRDKDPRVTEFLTQSALDDDFFAARAAGMDDRVPNLRVDKIGQSAPKRNGRPPKRPQPDAGFNDAADGGRMLAPAHARPAPADSTTPDAAGAGGASGPQPSAGCAEHTLAQSVYRCAQYAHRVLSEYYVRTYWPKTHF